MRIEYDQKTGKTSVLLNTLEKNKIADVRGLLAAMGPNGLPSATAAADEIGKTLAALNGTEKKEEGAAPAGATKR